MTTKRLNDNAEEENNNDNENDSNNNNNRSRKRQHHIMATTETAKAKGKATTFGGCGFEVFMWGGNDDENEGENKPIYLEGLRGKQVKQLACPMGEPEGDNTKSLAYCLSVDGQVRQWGPSPDWGRGNHKDRMIMSLPLITNNRIIVSIHCGWHHCMAVSSSGDLFSWGSGLKGQLGHGHRNFLDSPKRIETLAGIPIIQAACGFEHSLALSAQGHVYAWGDNEYGKTGLGGEAPQRAESIYLVPKQVKVMREGALVTTSDTVKISLIASGHSHNAILAQDSGAVYTWGVGSDGRLGHGNQKDCPVPTLVQALQQQYDHRCKAKQVACGCDQTAIVTEQGHVYTMGSNNSGILGHNDQTNRLEPTKIEAFKDIVITQVSLGQNHAAALTDKGETYTWGGGNLGNLGHGNQEDSWVPQKVQDLANLSVAHVMALDGCTIALVDPSSMGPSDLVPVATACQSMFSKEECAPVTFVVEQERIHSIRGILCRRCSYFATMLNSGMQEASSAADHEIEIKNIRSGIFKLILNYISTDTIHVQEETAVELFAAADMYGLPRLHDICLSWFNKNLSPENAVTLLLQAIDNKYDTLKHLCMEFIVAQSALGVDMVGMEQIKDPALFLEIFRGVTKSLRP